MSEWITDRKPTEEDTDGCVKWMVWTTYYGKVVAWTYDGVAEGTPWMPISKPEPYVAPKWKPTSKCSVWNEPFDFDKKYEWYVLCNGYRLADNIPTREAAERIAAIYNEVMP